MKQYILASLLETPRFRCCYFERYASKYYCCNL